MEISSICSECVVECSVECPEYRGINIQNEELVQLEDDVKELSQYERNLRDAVTALSTYLKHWQSSLNRMEKELVALEKKRHRLEKEAEEKKSKNKNNVFSGFFKSRSGLRYNEEI